MTNGFKALIYLSFLFFFEEAQETSTIVDNARLYYIFAAFPAAKQFGLQNLKIQPPVSFEFNTWKGLTEN